MAGMLSTGILDQLRARQESSFDQLCSIQRNTRTYDDQGGELWTWANLSTGVPCRVGSPALTAIERPLAGVVMPQLVTPFTFEVDVDILKTDRIIYPESGGSTYFVISDPDRGYKTATRVLAASIS